jgi:hypothetical protein
MATIGHRAEGWLLETGRGDAVALEALKVLLDAIRPVTLGGLREPARVIGPVRGVQQVPIREEAISSGQDGPGPNVRHHTRLRARA